MAETSKLLPHTKLAIGDVSEAVLVCGDPARATAVAGLLDEAALLAEWREYRSYQGMYNGRAVTVCSHGIGAPGAAIAFEELIAAGARIIIRVGTCGGIRPEVQAGHLVVVTGAVDHTGYGREVAPPGYPAAANVDVVVALRNAAKGTILPVHTGYVLTRDAFYGGPPLLAAPDYETMAAVNVLAVEMECAALFQVGSLRRIKTGAVLAADGNVLHTKEDMSTFDPHREEARQATETAIRIALDALVQVDDESG
ncbi:MAG TPA: nucleoside phosphorylase [Chloroflexota bacterium]|nr:nucleoside phosphorylase [Chloroflexota bacterium]